MIKISEAEWLPQDMQDAECPDCGRILAAPPYTQLSPEPVIAELCIACGGTGKRHRVSQEAMDWAAAQGPVIAEEKARNPDGIGYKSFQELKEAAGLSSPAPAQEVDPDYTGMFHAPAAQGEAAAVAWRVKDYADGWITKDEGGCPKNISEIMAAPAQGDADVIARMAALAELRRQISTEGRTWFQDRECVGPIDYQGIDIAEIVRVAIAALHPQQEAQARPASQEGLEPTTGEVEWAHARANDLDIPPAPQGELGMRERAAQVAEQAEERSWHGYRLESGALKQSIAAAIRSLAPEPQGLSTHPHEKVRQSLAYMRLFTAVRAWMKGQLFWETPSSLNVEVMAAMNAIDALSTRSEPPPEAFAQASIEATPTPEIIEWAESVFDRETWNEAVEACARLAEIYAEDIAGQRAEAAWDIAATCRALKRASP